MTAVSHEKRQFQFTGKHMLICMIGFFGVIIAVNLTMAMLASGSWTGLVVKNSYVASQQFNQELAGAQAQREAGYASRVSYFDGVLVFVLKDKDGSRLNVSGLTADIGRPAFEQADRTLTFLPGPEQTYRLPIELGPGIWALKIHGETQGSPYRRDIRLNINTKGKGVVE